MRQNRLLWFFFCFLSTCVGSYASAPPLLEWQRCLGGSGQDMPVHLIKGNDGFIYTLGSTASVDGDIQINRGSLDFWLTKQDSSGNLIWQKTYGGSNIDIGTGIIQIPGGGFLLAGYTSSNNGDVSGNHGNFDAWILKIDPSGNIIWQKTIGGSQVDLCYTIQLLQDGNYIFGGGTYSNDGDVSGHHGDQDFWLVKINQTGTILWQRALGGSGLDVCYDLIETANGQIIACGSTNSIDGQVSGNHGNYDLWINRLSSNGTLLSSRCYGGTEQESGLSLTVGSGNSIAVAGYSKSSNGDVSANFGYNDFWLCLIDSNGTIIREKNFGGSGTDVAYSVINTIDGGFLLTGGTTSTDYNVKNNHGAEDTWLVKTDANLTPEWSKTYGGSGNDRPSCSLENDDGGYIIASYSYSVDGDVSGNHGTSDFWIIRLSCKTPVAQFNLSTDSVCLNHLVQLTNFSLNTSANSWYLNNTFFSNEEEPYTSIARYGKNIIKLKTETCYSSSELQKQVYMSAPPTVQIDQSEPYLCTGSPIELSCSTSGAYSWSNGSTQSSIQISQGGIYQLSLSLAGCTVHKAINISEHTVPQFTLGNDTTICIGSSLMLNGPGNMQSYLWQDGSSQNNYLVTNPGLYELTISDQYCKSTDQINVNMTSCGFPIANFTASTQSICEDAIVSFQDLSGNATSWNWTFPGGNPSVSSQQNPNISYSQAGTYSVMLEAGNTAGTNIIMRVQFIVVKPNPYKPQVTLIGNQLNSTHADKYQWQMNQVNIAGAVQQSYEAMQSGNYRVEVTDLNQCKAVSDAVAVLITGLPSLRASGGGISVFPNPTYGDIQLQSNFNLAEPAEIRIFDTKASLVYAGSLSHQFPNEATTLDLSNLPQGTYFLEYRTQSGSVAGSILVKQ